MASNAIKKSKEWPVELVNEVFYCKNGTLYWNIDTKTKAKKHRRAGAVKPDNYIVVQYNKVMHYAHRIAFVLYHGRWPEGIVDHIDGNPQNNSKDNLRECTDSQNLFNSKGHKNNKSGVRGVSKHTDAPGWCAEICANRTRYRMYFHTFDEAVAWRRQKEVELFGEYRRAE